jgi:hypothetical protein
MRDLTDIHGIAISEFDERIKGYELPSRQTAMKIARKIALELDDATTDQELIAIFASEPSLYDAVTEWTKNTATPFEVMRSILSEEIVGHVELHWNGLVMAHGNLDQFKEPEAVEKITSSKYGGWICLCGNEADSDGFYPCDEQGNEVEGTPEDWDGVRYVCARCGRIIDQNTLAVIGQKDA